MSNVKKSTQEIIRLQENIVIGSDMEELTQWYLSSEQEMLDRLEKASKKRDFSALFTIGDQLYGHGASFGFPVISELGKKIEIAAVEKNATRVDGLISCLKFYLERVSVVYL